MDIKPEDFVELSEYDKQEILTDRLEHLYESFIMEYDMSEISVIGTFNLFIDALRVHYRHESEEEDDDGYD